VKATALRFIAGLVLLVALDAAGTWLVRFARIPIPGSVVGMLLLTALIELGIIPMALVRGAADLLVRHLALLYVPAGVAIISYAGIVREGVAPIVAAGLASLVAVLLVIGLIVQRFERNA
jgi:holin-like protein